MKARLFLSALFKLKNIGILVSGIIISFVLGNSGLIPYLITLPATFFIYILFLVQTLLSPRFHEEFKQKEKFRHISKLNRQVNRLYGEARKNADSACLHKLKKVIGDKDDIFNFYANSKPGYLEEKIVEKTLNLVNAYLKLMNNYCIRNRELNEMDLSAITARINENYRKLNFAQDTRMAEDLKKIIEMDEKLIKRLKEEKKDLERISAKLDYMESTVNVFKHQIMSSIGSEDMLEQLETAVNEAEALDTVLEERRRYRLKY